MIKYSTHGKGDGFAVSAAMLRIAFKRCLSFFLDAAIHMMMSRKGYRNFVYNIWVAESRKSNSLLWLKNLDKSNFFRGVYKSLTNHSLYLESYSRGENLKFEGISETFASIEEDEASIW